MAIVNQYTGVRNGNPNTKFYTSQRMLRRCITILPAGRTRFPVQEGRPIVPLLAPATQRRVMKGYTASAGFDLATGWGSVDAYNLVINWGCTHRAQHHVADPSPMTGSASSQTLSINGAGFTAGSGLTVKVGTATYSGRKVTFTNSSLLTVSVNVGTTVQTLPVVVTNPNGQASNSVNLSSHRSSPASGDHLALAESNDRVELRAGPDHNWQRLSAGSEAVIGSTTILSTQLMSLSSTQIQVDSL